mgnify:CR=1 FL=1
MDFVHLRLQSSYSLLESTLKINRIIDKAKELSMNSVAMTDRNNLFGSLEFAMDASKKGLKPIHGAILNITEGAEIGEILILAKDESGYKNLLKLASHIYTKPDREANLEISIDDLRNNSEGLIVLSGYTNGHIGKALLANDFAKAKKYAEIYKEICEGRFYFEIMRHNLDQEKSIENSYIKLASELSIPLVATNNVVFEDIESHDSHDVLLCIAEGVVKEQQERSRVSNQCYFKTPGEMLELFKDIPEAIENACHIVKRCNVMALPRKPELPRFVSDDTSESDALKEASHRGLEQRLEQKFILENIPDSEKQKIKDEYFKRIDYELEIICKMEFSGYFLIVSDFIKWSKNQKIPVGPGRGSGAGSVVAWSLLITDLDPIKFGLLFERFLNPERISMPDFDIDFCQEGRDKVIQYVRNKYGNGKVGQIITFGKMQAKAVIKDVARVLGLRYEYADYLTELVPFNAVSPVTLGQAIEEVAELGAAAKGSGLYNLQGEEELIKHVLETALILEGLHRHVSVHAAGIVIGARDLIDILPLYKDKSSDMLIIQYSMKYAEAIGLVKFDFLGLQTLTLIDKCANLAKGEGHKVDLENLTFSDQNTYKLLTKGDSAGVFQFESVGMKDALRKLKPDCIEDIMALGALYRPGPMDNIPTYIACKHRRAQPDYLDPKLENTLKQTYGVIIYQEQVLEMARVIAGYSLGTADLLRRAMGKKIKSEMDAQEIMFTEGAVQNGMKKEKATNLFAAIAKFAGYGFNKSHAAAYGVISYQTAYLKANFTREFLTTCLNLDINDSDKINLFIEEVKNHQIEIIPPDITRCSGCFKIEEDRILFGLGAIKNVTTSLGDAICTERQKGTFKNVMDFIERMPAKLLNKRGLESLIKAGALDSLHTNRAELLSSVPKLISHANNHHLEKQRQQFSLLEAEAKYVIDQAEDFDEDQKAIMEFEVCGVFLRNHPLQKYYLHLQDKGAKSSLQIKNEMEAGSYRIDIAGIIQKKDSRMSPRGRFITLQLSDQFGNFEITIFNEAILKDYASLLDIKNIVSVSCDMYKDEGGLRLTAIKFAPIEDYLRQNYKELSLHPKHMEDLEKISSVASSKITDVENANTKIILMLPSDDSMVAKIELPPLKLDFEDIRKLKTYEST